MVATLGPPCRDTAALTELLKAGCTAVRVDLTWGPIEYHVQSLKNVAAACKATGKLCAVIVDTVGRELFIRRPITLDAQARVARRQHLVAGTCCQHKALKMENAAMVNSSCSLHAYLTATEHRVSALE